MDNIVRFFSKKRSWSNYKDGILDYYLEPYLVKVSKLQRPILIVDCFAGPGKFGDGSLGSPLIISNRLAEISKRNIQVHGYFIESNNILYEQLEKNTSVLNIKKTVRNGCFRNYIDEIAYLAKTHTVFVYLDPIKPSDLLFDDLKAVYDNLRSGQSVETLINLMSRNFLRGIWGNIKKFALNKTILNNHPLVIDFNNIAGGPYWQHIVTDHTITQKDQIDLFAKEYTELLHRWFNWTIHYPVREKYSYQFPKYHLVFGSRSPDAVDLMNRSMVNARRKFVAANYVEGMLFPNQPEKEVVKPIDVERKILEVARKIGKTTWKMLRIYSTIDDPCMYTDSEFNHAIKKSIRKGILKSSCPGTKIENDAYVWVSDKT